jgi:hypothetical protein
VLAVPARFFILPGRRRVPLSGGTAIGYWLLAIGYSLLAIGYWLLAIGYSLFAIRYSPLSEETQH